jgi:hypothetical protein
MLSAMHEHATAAPHKQIVWCVLRVRKRQTRRRQKHFHLRAARYGGQDGGERTAALRDAGATHRQPAANDVLDCAMGKARGGLSGRLPDRTGESPVLPITKAARQRRPYHLVLPGLARFTVEGKGRIGRMENGCGSQKPGSPSITI